MKRLASLLADADRLPRRHTVLACTGAAGIVLTLMIAAGGAGEEERPESRSTPGTVLRSAPDDAADSPQTEAEAPPLLAPLPTGGTGMARVALVIDDLGNNPATGERALALPGAVTYAILPHAPHSRTLAERARTLGKEIMLHAPMSNDGRMALGRGALTTEQTREEFLRTFDRALAEVPGASGVNNHTGSRLTAEERPMRWLMETLQAKRLYFLDSLTSPHSVAAEIAGEYGIPHTKRQVFLDNERTREAIDRQFRRVLAIAAEEGRAVAIGHPYPQTLSYLETVLPSLQVLGYQLVSVSELLDHRARQ